MQGFIININKVKDEDLIVTILTQNKVQTTYRFYGSRHGVINLGFLIDFETQSSMKSNIAQLRNIIHLAQPWNLQRERMYIWQQFIKLFYPHLKDTEDIGNFYFDALKESVKIWNKQSPKRVAIETYVKLLEHEGRLHSLKYCFLCDELTTENIALARAFLPAHELCIHNFTFDKSKILELFKLKQTMFLNDDEVNRLWNILCEGL